MNFEDILNITIMTMLISKIIFARTLQKHGKQAIYPYQIVHSNRNTILSLACK